MSRLEIPGLERLRADVRRQFLRAWRLDGRERHGGTPLTVCYAGSDIGFHYIAHLAFGDRFKVTRLGRSWLRRIPPLAKSIGAGLTVIETDPAGFERHADTGDWLVPAWVDGDLTQARAAVTIRGNRGVKHDLGRVRRNGLSPRVTTEVPMLEHFYARMYRPYMTKAHGSRATYMSRELMLAWADRLELLLIERDGEAIAGGLLRYGDDGVRFWTLGVLDGDRRHVNDGAIAALYYYKMQHLASRGHDRCSEGASRAFLRDGVLQYKRKWGMTLSHARSGGFWLRHRAVCDGACSFLVHNPFIHRRGGRLYGLGFVADGEAPVDAVERFARLHGGLGLDGWAVVPVRPHATAAACAPRRAAGRRAIACGTAQMRTAEGNPVENA